MAIFNTVYGGEWPWKPWANTMLYLPMKTNFDDATWNNIMTNSWATITTLNWVSCWYFYNSTLTCSASPLATNNKTISIWLNITTLSSNWVIWSNHSGAASWDYIRFSSGEWILGSTYWWSAWDTKTTTLPPENTWFHLVWSGWNFYLNWTDVTTTQWTVAAYTQGYPYTIWRQNNWGNTYYWYMSELIVEDKIRTAQEIANYYNQTKSNYWL